MRSKTQILVNVHQDSVDVLKSKNIPIGPLIREFLDEFLDNYMAFDQKETLDLMKLERDLDQVASEILEKNAQAKRLACQIETIKKRIANEERKKQEDMRRQAEKLNTCVLCECLLSERKTKIEYGPHAGKYVCGSISRGCTYSVFNSENKWWIRGKKNV